MPIRPQHTSVALPHWIAVMQRSNEAEADFKEAVCPPLRVIGVSQLGSTELTHCKRVNYSQRQLLAAFTEFAPHGAVFWISRCDCSPSRKNQKHHRHLLAGTNSPSNYALASYLICAVVNKSGAAAVPKSDGFGEIRLYPARLGAHVIGVT